MIFGRNAKTAPTPANTPSMSKLDHQLGATNPLNHSPNKPTPLSIQSCG